MQIKRFIAPDRRQEMQMIKDEFGHDAVIMSHRSVDQGVEIVAAKNFDETVFQPDVKDEMISTNIPDHIKPSIELVNFDAIEDSLHIVSSSRKRDDDDVTQKEVFNKNLKQPIALIDKADLASNPFIEDMRDEIKSLKATWDAEPSQAESEKSKNNNSMRANLFHYLADMGVSHKLAVKLANQVTNDHNATSVFAQAKALLMTALPIADEKLMDEGGIVALIGATGIGKTTTVVKLAAQFILKHGAGCVALITTDNYKVGAHEQLSAYGRLLNVPVRVATNAQTLRSHLDGFANKRLILIDTAGMSPRDMQLTNQIQTLQQYHVPIKTYLVMSASTQQKALDDIVHAFKIFKPVAIILTKLDETVSLGSTLSTIIQHQLPLSFVSHGQKVPEDICLPDVDQLINQCVTPFDTDNNVINDDIDEWWSEVGYA